MSRKIFISYRREDSIATSGRLRDRLAQTFGAKRIFMDVDDIPHGRDFAKELTEQIAACDVFLAIIGRSWLHAQNDVGHRRLDDPADFVRIEVGAALNRDIAVIPVLVDGARMPRADELPEAMKALARRQAIELRNAQFGSDVERLVRAIRAASPRVRGVPWQGYAAAVGVALLGGAMYYYASSGPDRGQTAEKIRLETEAARAREEQAQRAAKARAEQEVAAKLESEARERRAEEERVRREARAKAELESQGKREAQALAKDAEENKAWRETSLRAFAKMGVDPQNTLVMELKTGKVLIKLRPDLAPRHVERAKVLARQGFYDGLKFHRVIDGFMAQTGDPTGTGTGGSKLPDLTQEFTREVYRRGSVGAARTNDPNSANSQFFICFGDACGQLTGKYTLWGEVIEGMEHVDKITRGQPPARPDVMQKVYLLADANK